MHIASLSLKINIIIYLAQKVLIVLLSVEKGFENILTKYLDFENIFSKNVIVELYKYLAINKYIINIEKSKQLSYRPIYNLKLVDIEIFKT